MKNLGAWKATEVVLPLGPVHHTLDCEDLSCHGQKHNELHSSHRNLWHQFHGHKEQFYNI